MFYTNFEDKFCYRRGKFQNTEAATEGDLKNFTKFIGKHLCQRFFFKQSCRPQARFSKYESLHLIAAARPQLSDKKLF